MNLLPKGTPFKWDLRWCKEIVCIQIQIPFRCKQKGQTRKWCLYSEPIVKDYSKHWQNTIKARLYDNYKSGKTPFFIIIKNHAHIGMHHVMHFIVPFLLRRTTIIAAISRPWEKIECSAQTLLCEELTQILLVKKQKPIGFLPFVHNWTRQMTKDILRCLLLLIWCGCWRCWWHGGKWRQASCWIYRLNIRVNWGKLAYDTTLYGDMYVLKYTKWASVFWQTLFTISTSIYPRKCTAFPILKVNVTKSNCASLIGAMSHQHSACQKREWALGEYIYPGYLQLLSNHPCHFLSVLSLRLLFFFLRENWKTTWFVLVALRRNKYYVVGVNIIKPEPDFG